MPYSLNDWMDTEDPDDPFGIKLQKGAYRLGRGAQNMYSDIFGGGSTDEDHAPPSAPGPMNLSKPPETENFLDSANPDIRPSDDKDTFVGPPAPEGYTPPRDLDKEMMEYTKHANEAPPSERMYNEYMASKPDYDKSAKGGIWRSIGAALLTLGGEQGQKAADVLLHPGYEKAYKDWETQGKFLNQRASAADAARQRALNVEKFGIEQEAGKRKEALQSQKETQAAIHQQEVDKRSLEASERADAAAARLEGTAAETARHNRAMEARGIAADERAANKPTMTVSQGLSAQRAIKADYDKNTKDTRTVQRHATNMNSGLAMAEKAAKEGGDLNAASQTIITEFNKLMDPASVVRESEYARSAAGQSFLSRLEGMQQKLAQGGAGLTIENLRALNSMAQEFAKNAETFRKEQEGIYRSQAEQLRGESGGKYGDDKYIFGSSGGSNVDIGIPGVTVRRR